MSERRKGVDEAEHGKRASFDPKSGEVRGSGSNAGGGGTSSEDYDTDPHGGSGPKPHGARPIDKAVERPIDPEEGT